MTKKKKAGTPFTLNESIQAKKALGQHFLNDPKILGKIAELAKIDPSLPVVEIGPGTGTLTHVLLQKARHLITIEKDGELLPLLQEKFSAEISDGRLTIVAGDIRTFNPEQYGLHSSCYHLVANIPYYITGEILRFFLGHPICPKNATLLVQKEVAQRIAKDRKESVLSLSVKAYGVPSVEGIVKRGSFSPPPKVDSAILRIEDISKTAFADVSEENFFKVVKAGFKSKRKMLHGNLATFRNATDLQKIFAELNIPWSTRAEDVPLSKWFLLATRLTNQAES